MNKKEALLKKNSGQLRSIIVDATAVTGNLKILKLVKDLGGHFITSTTKKENPYIANTKILSATSLRYYLLSLKILVSSFYSVRSIIIILSGQKAVEIPCGEGYAKLGKRAGE